MIISKLFLCIIQLILIINLTQSQNICLDNAVLTCHCEDEMEYVSCFGKETNNSFVDWTTFTSVNHRRYSFTFVNLTRLTSLTFTNFTSVFSERDSVIDFTFINGLDEIGENAFEELRYYSNEPIDITFTSPRNFKLADYAFARGRYFEIIIDSIQYSYIHNLPYQFNLKSMDDTDFYQMTIKDSGEIQFVSNGSSTIEFRAELTVKNCSLADVSLLIESLSTTIVDLDLSYNRLTKIPSLNKFQEMHEIDLKYNLIEEIPENIFNNMENLWRIDLSNNRIKYIASDAFIGLSLIELELNNNFLTSLETTSFLYPIKTSLAFFGIANNLIHDLSPLKHLINLDNLTACCNRIKTLNANVFNEAIRLESVDLSYNQIEFIDSMAFNGTIMQHLYLDGNPFSSLETKISDTMNETSSFLYPISSSIISLSLTNCTNLFEINWFIITKLERFYELNLSELNKTETFWLYRKTDINNEESAINWIYPPGLRLILHGIQLTDNDYCLTKQIEHILNKTTFLINIDHPCNCFIFKFKDSFDEEQRPLCLLNNSTLSELNNRCANIDLFCELFLNGTTISSSTELTSSLFISSTTLTSTPIMTFHTETIRTTDRFSSNTTYQSSVSSTISMTITSTTQLLQQPNGNPKRTIILAIIIPTICIIMLGLTTVYILKRRKMKKSDEIFELVPKTWHITDVE